MCLKSSDSDLTRHTPPDARHALTPHEHALIPNPTERSTTARSRSINKGIKTLCAQCYPRHACALCRSLFMHLHEVVRAAPGLGLTGKLEGGINMQNHALYACSPKFEFKKKKSHCNSYSGLQKTRFTFHTQVLNKLMAGQSYHSF
ncbi:Uncharacterised protein [Yersinia mollaretii]|uniref:Uncharacterized protein n=1 Tax=Yersinia mollaretii TaxID=33060 RepID=A0AA36LQC2_YERMO|nr:Uncharacterised protein [Yersinia mollaretii]